MHVSTLLEYFVSFLRTIRNSRNANFSDPMWYCAPKIAVRVLLHFPRRAASPCWRIGLWSRSQQITHFCALRAKEKTKWPTVRWQTRNVADQCVLSKQSRVPNPIRPMDRVIPWVNYQGLLLRQRLDLRWNWLCRQWILWAWLFQIKNPIKCVAGGVAFFGDDVAVFRKLYLVTLPVSWCEENSKL